MGEEAALSIESPLREAKFLGLKLHPITMLELCQRIIQTVVERERLTITYINPNYVVAASRSPKLAAAINQFDLVLPDGIGVVVGARFLGVPVPERLGTDGVCLSLFGECARRRLPLKVFLLGARPGIAETAAENLQSGFPTITVVGTRHGWFDSRENEQVCDAVNSSQPDMLLVCTGTPRQQYWVSAHAASLRCPVIMTGGGYLDNLSVSVAFYPQWINHARLNWLYRLCREPKNVWRRYTIEAAIFSYLLLTARTRRRESLGCSQGA